MSLIQTMTSAGDLEHLNIAADQVTSKDLTEFFSAKQFEKHMEKVGANQVLVDAGDEQKMEEFLTPGADMSEVLQTFVNAHS